MSVCLLVLFRFVSFRFVSFRFVSFRFVSFRFVSFRFVSFRFFSFRFVSFRFVSFHFVSLCFASLFRFASFRFTSFCFLIQRQYTSLIALKEPPKPVGFWSSEKGKNMRQYLEKFIRAKNLDPFLASSWYHVNRPAFLKLKV